MTYIIQPDILGTFLDYKFRYYADDRYSLPENVWQGGVDARYDPATPGQPRTSPSADSTPAAVPYQDLKPAHLFSSAFTSDYDD